MEQTRKFSEWVDESEIKHYLHCYDILRQYGFIWADAHYIDGVKYANSYLYTKDPDDFWYIDGKPESVFIKILDDRLTTIGITVSRGDVGNHIIGGIYGNLDRLKSVLDFIFLND